ncbi:unnamed protein product [Bemisia tabaci]|uniref:Transcription termination factor n=2 Tax=Bemisia tabaci TaxID=7038 RepID=A0A9P0CF35_BEMTA|nr:unnamed protein product [Bemisia tabaci]
MNRSVFQICLSAIHGPTSIPSRSVMKQMSKFSIAHVSNRSYFVNFILGDRQFNMPVHVEKKQEEGLSLQSFSLFQSFKTRNERRLKICELLQCSSADANSIMQIAINQRLFDDPETSATFFDKLKLLHQIGLDAKLVAQHQWLFDFSLGELEKKIEAFRQKEGVLKIDELNLLKLRKAELLDLLDLLEEDRESLMETRIDFFSREFGLSIPEVCSLLVERSFLRRKSLQQIMSIYQKLKDAGVSKSEIRNDFWIFKHKKQTIEERIQLAKRLQFDQFKCWMSRCNLRALKRSAEILTANKKILDKYKTREALLMEKLHIDEAEVGRICDTYPQLSKIRETKILHMIDFLMSEGITEDQIRAHPKILCHSPRTLKKRINELVKLGAHVPNVYVFCLNQRLYDRYIEKFLGGSASSSVNEGPVKSSSKL